MKHHGQASLKVHQTGERSVQNRYTVGPDLHLCYNKDMLKLFNSTKGILKVYIFHLEILFWELILKYSEGFQRKIGQAVRL